MITFRNGGRKLGNSLEEGFRNRKEFEAGPEGDATGEQNLITGMVSLSGCMTYSFIETGASQSFVALRPLLIEICGQPNLEIK
jgi:hypothetical protein